MSFDKLLAELDGLVTDQETMRKALPAGDGEDDKNIQAAAAEGGDMDDVNVDGKAPTGDDDDDEDGGEPMGKSLGTVTLESGEQVEAVDGTELVKSLMDQVGKLGEQQTASEQALTKAVETCVTLIKSNNDMVKSLQEEIVKLRGEGRGRKTVLNVSEKPAAGTQLAKSEPTGMTGAEFLAKSHAAFDARKITGTELTTIDVALRSGAPVDPKVIQKVLS